MKRIHIQWLLIFLFTGCLTSCFEDKGNYDYSYAPEVIMPENAGLRDTVIKRGQRLTIIPNLQMLLTEDGEHKDTVDFDEERFAYEWHVYGRLITSYDSVLATTRNLDTIIDLPLTTGDPYRVIYSVIDKNTDVAWNFKFNLSVQNRYENAWLFLVEDDNQMVDLTLYGKELDNASEDPWVWEEGVLSRSGFPYLGGGAKFVYYKSNTSLIYVGTGEATGWITKNELEWSDRYLVRYQMASMQPVDYTFEGIEQASAWLFMGTAGDIYPMGNDGLIMEAINILPPSASGTGHYETIKLAPFVGGYTTSAYKLVFDETNKRMMYTRVSGGNAQGTASQLTGEAAIPNHKLYFLQSYDGGLYNTVIAKNLSNEKFYKYVYDPYTSPISIIETTEITNGNLLEETEGILERTKQYVCDYFHGTFYTTDGNKIYCLRNNTLQEVNIQDPDNLLGGQFNDFDPVCLLTRYTLIESTRGCIIVATYNTGTEKSGKVYFLEPNATEPLNLTVRDYFEGLDRVKSISRF